LRRFHSGEIANEQVNEEKKKSEEYLRLTAEEPVPKKTISLLESASKLGVWPKAFSACVATCELP
jgi:hypothetical protein